MQILLGDENKNSVINKLPAETVRLEKQSTAWKWISEEGETSAGGSIAPGLAALAGWQPRILPSAKCYIWKVLWPFINLLSPWLSGTRRE